MAGLAVAISSRKIVPPSASLNLPILSPIAPVNAPATWPNSSLSSNVSGRAPQATSTNGLSRRPASTVNRPRDHRLAGAAFAGDQHAGAGVGDAIDHFENAAHAIVLADDALQAEADVELRLEILVLFDDAAMIQGPIDRHFQLVVDDRLGDQVEGAGANGLDGGFDGAVAGHQDDGRVRALLAAMGQDVEAVAIAQAQVDQGQVVMSFWPTAAMASATPVMASTAKPSSRSQAAMDCNKGRSSSTSNKDPRFMGNASPWRGCAAENRAQGPSRSGRGQSRLLYLLRLRSGDSRERRTADRAPSSEGRRQRPLQSSQTTHSPPGGRATGVTVRFGQARGEKGPRLSSNIYVTRCARSTRQPGDMPRDVTQRCPT